VKNEGGIGFLRCVRNNLKLAKVAIIPSGSGRSVICGEHGVKQGRCMAALVYFCIHIPDFLLWNRVDGKGSWRSIISIVSIYGLLPGPSPSNSGLPLKT
jgi:hypothetical protein